MIFFRFSEGGIHKEFVPPDVTVNQNFILKSWTVYEGDASSTANCGKTHYDIGPAHTALSASEFLPKKYFSCFRRFLILHSCHFLIFTCSKS
jgi:hypothetical protein